MWESVAEQLRKEEEAGLTTGEVFVSFCSQVVQSKYDLLALLGQLRKSGAQVFGVGAPSRASTLINWIRV